MGRGPHSSSRLRRCVVAASLASALAAVPLDTGAQTESFLAGPQGPYRGRVVELLTEKPLARAVVVIVWEADPDGAGGREVFAAKDLLTDEAGGFQLDAADVERGLPPRAYPPRFVVYKPGFVAYPREPRWPFGAPASRFVRGVGVVELKPVAGAEERAEALNTAVAIVNRWVGIPGNESLAQFMALVREELQRYLRESTPAASPGKPRP